MCEKLCYQTINTLDANQTVFCYLKIAKIIIKKSIVDEECTFLNSFNADFIILIYVDFGKSEFLHIPIFSWYIALYCACILILLGI